MNSIGRVPRRARSVTLGACLVKNSVKLDADATNQTLDSAIRTQAQIVLESPEWDNVTLNGYLISGDDKALLMELTGKPKIRLATLPNSTCQAQLYAEQRYVFETKISATPQWGGTQAIAIERPTSLRVLDRRQFARARLAPSSTVKLEWTSDGLARRYTATLLNISPDGLACRVEAPVAESIEAGDILTSRFTLPQSESNFNVESSVLNKTPTGEGPFILGLQFVRSQRNNEELLRLRKTLTGRSPVATAVETFA